MIKQHLLQTVTDRDDDIDDRDYDDDRDNDGDHDGCERHWWPIPTVILE